jgi:activator of 2-hydroxyglutaryl-CoA dehydratase
MICRVLGISISDMGAISQNAHEVLSISNTCAVFAESEVISRLSQGYATPDILAGIHTSIAKRIYGLVMRIGLIEDVALTGGVASNVGIVKALNEELHTKLLIPPEPQMTGALGAALFAMEKWAFQSQS